MAALPRCSLTPLQSSVGMQAMGPSLLAPCKLPSVSLNRPRLANLSGGEKRFLVISSRKQQVLRCSADGISTTQHVLQARSTEEVYINLGDRLSAAAEALQPDHKYLVGIAGPPGAGKSTLSREVVNRVNEKWRQKAPSFQVVEDIAIVLPMDGFHLYRWQLDAMEDPVEAHAQTAYCVETSFFEHLPQAVSSC